MDKLANLLREDARRIDGRVGPELDARIEASLRAASPVITAAPPPRRSPLLRWGAGLAAGAAAVIAAVSLHNPTEPAPASTVPGPVAQRAAVPIDFDGQASELVTPLSRELDNLQADLRRAEAVLRDDLGL